MRAVTVVSVDSSVGQREPFSRWQNRDRNRTTLRVNAGRIGECQTMGAVHSFMYISTCPQAHMHINTHAHNIYMMCAVCSLEGSSREH